MRGASSRMPFGGADAEPRREAIEELRGQRDLRHQDQHLLAAPDRLGHRLEIDLGLARAGDAVDQGHGEAARADAGAQRIGRGALRVGELRHGEVRIGLPRHRLRRQHQRFQRAVVDQAIDRRPATRRPRGPPRSWCAAGRRRAAPARGSRAGGHALRRRARRGGRRPCRAPGRDRPCAGTSAAPCRAGSACSRRPSRRSRAARASAADSRASARRPSCGCAGRAGSRRCRPRPRRWSARAPSGTATMSPTLRSSSRGTL